MNTTATLSTKNKSKEEWLAARLRHLWKKRQTAYARNAVNRERFELQTVQVNHFPAQVETT